MMVMMMMMIVVILLYRWQVMVVIGLGWWILMMDSVKETNVWLMNSVCISSGSLHPYGRK